jgi:hypothetical protein
MAETTDIYGTQTSNGQEVTYRDATGNLRPAVIKNLHVPVYRADLEVSMPDGNTKFVEGALYNQGPAEGCWVHRKQEEAKPAPEGLETSAPDESKALGKKK